MKGYKLFSVQYVGSFRRALMLVFLLSLTGFAQQPAKPVCSAKIRGQFWPNEANHSPAAIRTLAQSGKLELCAARMWKFRWESLTINYADLLKKHRASWPRRPPTRLRLISHRAVNETDPAQAAGAAFGPNYSLPEIQIP